MGDLPDRGASAGLADLPSLRHALRRAVETARPELQVVAEGLLAEVSPIDLLAIGAEGELVAIRVASPGGDLETLTQLLADLSWLRPRRSDFLRLTPGLGIDPSLEPRALLVAAAFGRETRAAIENFPADTVQLWRSQPAREDGQVVLRINPIEADGASPCFKAPRSAPPQRTLKPPRPAAPQRSPSPQRSAPCRPEPGEDGVPLTNPPSPSAFRTGLRESDLVPAPRPAVDRISTQSLGDLPACSGSPGG